MLLLVEDGKLRRLIQRAIDRAYEPYTLDEVADEIESGRSTIFIGERSALICQLQSHNGVISGHGWLAAGDLDELCYTLGPMAEDWARQNGATSVTIDGRRGWVRALARTGYKEQSVTVRKVL